MNLRIPRAVLLLSLPLLAACAATAPATPTTRAAAPTDTTRKPTTLLPAEDLTKYRPAFATSPAQKPLGHYPSPQSRCACPY
jgi:hypothetical protein